MCKQFNLILKTTMVFLKWLGYKMFHTQNLFVLPSADSTTRMADDKDLLPPANKRFKTTSTTTVDVIELTEEEPVLPSASSPKHADTSSSFSKSQRNAIEYFLQGKNIMVTGAAGSGKSHVVREFCRLALLANRHFLVCASTGAATQQLLFSIGQLLRDAVDDNDDDETMEGYTPMTLHSAFRIPTKIKSIPTFVTSIQRDTIRPCSLFIIDEISMISAQLFDYVNRLCCLAKASSLPFGNIQVVVCGDFAQLSPVPDKDATGSIIPASAMYAFQSKAWHASNFITCNLDVVYRQASDSRFVSLLHRARFGKLTLADEALLQSRVKPLSTLKTTQQNNAITCIDSRRTHVEEYNRTMLKQLPSLNSQVYTTCGIDLVRENFDYHTKLPQGSIFTGSMEAWRLKHQKAAAMTMEPFVLTNNKLLVQQALIHSQGQTNLYYTNNATNTMNYKPSLYGNVYERLKKNAQSRLFTNDLTLELRINARVIFCFNHPNRILVNGSIGQVVGMTPPLPLRFSVETSQNLKTRKTLISILEPQLPQSIQYPIVRFDGHDTDETIYYHFILEVDEITGAVYALVYLPLCLAFAWTGHRSQGSTLRGNVHINLNNTFAHGQGYVMLSRCTSLNQITIEPPLYKSKTLISSITADPLVVAFYNQ